MASARTKTINGTGPSVVSTPIAMSGKLSRLAATRMPPTMRHTVG